MPLVTVPVLIKTRISIVDFMWQERSPYMEDAITQFSREFRSALGIIMALLKPRKALYFALIWSFLVRLFSRHNYYLMCNVGAFLFSILTQFFSGDSLSGSTSNDLVRFQSFDKKCKAGYACKILIYLFWTIFMFLPGDSGSAIVSG